MATASSTYQDVIFNAFDTYFNQRTKELKLDKTITAIVKKPIGTKNSFPRYRLQYSGGTIDATATDVTASYAPNTSVYVMVPENNFSNEKFIIGRASQFLTDKEQTVVAATANKYSVLSSNLLKKASKNDKPLKEQIYGLHSYHSPEEENETIVIDGETVFANPDAKNHRELLLYKNNSDKNSIAFDEESFKIVKENTSVLMFKADFQTILDSAQRETVASRYYLRFDFAFTNLNAGLGRTQGEILQNIGDIVKANVVEYNYSQSGSVEAVVSNKTLNEYDNEINVLLQQQNGSLNDIFADNTGKLDQYYNYITSLYEAFSTDKSNNTTINNIVTAYKNMLQDLRNVRFDIVEEDISTQNWQKMWQIYVDWKEAVVGDDALKIISYYLSSDRMLGNPLVFSSWNTQYTAFEIDLDTFHHLESIYFIKEGFIEDSKLEKQWPLSDLGGPDIKVKNLQLYAMKPLDAESGDYTLKVEPVENNDFILTNDEENSSTMVQAILMRRNIENLTSNSNVIYYWFKEDPNITTLNSSVSDGYNYLAGAGWRDLKIKGTSKITLYAEENQAYKNNYRCVAVYELEDGDVVLYTDFSIYNKDAGLEIILESDLGTEFAFDAGTPKVTAKIKTLEDEDFQEKAFISNETTHNLPMYKYLWAIKDSSNDPVFLSDENNSSIKSSYYSLIQSIQKFKIIQKENKEIEEVALTENEQSWNATRIKYPVSALSAGFTVTCYVQQLKLRNYDYKYVDVGSASINFTNRLDGVASDYYISIVNGDQVFQYDEYGNAPTVSKLKEPLEILPLQCKLFSPSGIEVQGTNYEVEWIFELENTLIIPKETLINNPKTGLIQMFKGHECTFDIEQLYNPNYYNNQITCHVQFAGKQIYKDTNFYFGKQGNNGTNGTDIVAKIVLANDNNAQLLHSQPLTAYIQNVPHDNNDDFKVMFNYPDTNIALASEKKLTIDGLNDSNGILDIKLYRKNEEIPRDEIQYVNWNLAGNNVKSSNTKSKYFKVSSTGDSLSTSLSFDPNYLQYNNNNLEFLFQNIRAEVKLKGKEETYYAFFSLPIIKYHTQTPKINSLLPVNKIAIERSTYLNEIVYNADGRNPIYNHQAGLKLINLPDKGSVSWSVKGGLSQDEDTPCIKLYYVETDTEGNSQEIMIDAEHQPVIQERTCMVYVIPDDVFNGSTTNNRIEAIVKDKDGNLIATVYAPINMTLNTFGLASLNAWDGNTVTIDEEGGYIMAPQIGAGEKDKNNRFTGVLMGKTETYTGGASNEKELGLFGYSHGLQSIFLDAKTGNADFGLPDGYILEEDNNYIPVPRTGNVDSYNEGRIELRPGAVSKVGGWRVGRTSLYYESDPESNNVVDIGKKYNQDKVPNQKGELAWLNTYNEHHKKDIDPDHAGILLQAGNQPYISIKGQPLSQDKIVNTLDSYLLPLDSLEVQLDPQSPTLFTIFRHNGMNRGTEVTENNNEIYRTRTYLAGINAKGELVANSLGATSGNTTSSLSIKAMPAFEDYADENLSNNQVTQTSYIGLKLGAGNYTLGQIFINNSEYDPTQIPNTLFITGGGGSRALDTNGTPTGGLGEYQRPISINGNTINLYASNQNSNAHKLTTDANIKIEGDQALIQTGNTYFKLLRSNHENTEYKTLQKDANVLITKSKGFIGIGQQISIKNENEANEERIEYYNEPLTVKSGNFYGLINSTDDQKNKISFDINVTNENKFEIENKGCSNININNYNTGNFYIGKHSLNREQDKEEVFFKYSLTDVASLLVEKEEGYVANSFGEGIKFGFNNNSKTVFNNMLTMTRRETEWINDNKMIFKPKHRFWVETNDAGNGAAYNSVMPQIKLRAGDNLTHTELQLNSSNDGFWNNNAIKDPYYFRLRIDKEKNENEFESLGDISVQSVYGGNTDNNARIQRLRLDSNIATYLHNGLRIKGQYSFSATDGSDYSGIKTNSLLGDRQDFVGLYLDNAIEMKQSGYSFYFADTNISSNLISGVTKTASGDSLMKLIKDCLNAAAEAHARANDAHNYAQSIAEALNGHTHTVTVTGTTTGTATVSAAEVKKGAKGTTTAYQHKYSSTETSAKVSRTYFMQRDVTEPYDLEGYEVGNDQYAFYSVVPGVKTEDITPIVTIPYTVTATTNQQDYVSYHND